MIETVEHPTFDRADFDSASKAAGLSAIVCLKNEAEFALASLESINPSFDEIIIVYNGCTDRTPEIVAEFARQQGNRVRAFHYVPRVAPLGSREHQTTPANSIHSFVHQCNFALSKASFQIRCHWGGDQIADPISFRQLTQRLRQLPRGSIEWWLSPWRFGYWWYMGMNLWDKQGQLFVSRQYPFLGTRRDHGFFPAGRWIFFKRYSHGEYLFKRLLAKRFMGCVFYHLRGLKKHQGLDKYQLNQNPRSLQEWEKRFWMNPDLITVDEFRAQEPLARQLPLPETLGIFPPPND